MFPKLKRERDIIDSVNVAIIESYRASPGGKQERWKRLPSSLLGEDFYCFKRIIATVLKPLLEEKSVTKIWTNTEISTLD
jgi:hypothetical protein